jgi:hypothetical protein
MLGQSIYKTEIRTNLIIWASVKVVAPIMAFCYSLKSPYKVHQSHIRLLKIIVDYSGTVVKALAIMFISRLAVQFDNISSFFYMNTFIVLVINVFYQSYNHRDLLKVKVTGYFYFIMLSSSLTLLLCTYGVLWMYWKADSKDPFVASEKRKFIYNAYLVGQLYPRNLPLNC